MEPRAELLHRIALLICWGNGVATQNGHSAGISILGGGNSSSVHPLPSPSITTRLRPATGNLVASFPTGPSCAGGDDNFGALGNGGTNLERTNPTLGGPRTGLTADSVAFGNHYGCAVLNDGSLNDDRNDEGQLGDGTTTDRNTPVAISLGTGRTAKAIAVHNAHTCTILDDDSVRCWGDDTWGDLGNGVGVTHSTSPTVNVC